MVVTQGTEMAARGLDGTERREGLSDRLLHDVAVLAHRDGVRSRPPSNRGPSHAAAHGCTARAWRLDWPFVAVRQPVDRNVVQYRHGS